MLFHQSKPILSQKKLIEDLAKNKISLNELSSDQIKDKALIRAAIGGSSKKKSPLEILYVPSTILKEESFLLELIDLNPAIFKKLCESKDLHYSSLIAQPNILLYSIKKLGIDVVTFIPKHLKTKPMMETIIKAFQTENYIVNFWFIKLILTFLINEKDVSLIKDYAPLLQQIGSSRILEFCNDFLQQQNIIPIKDILLNTLADHRILILFAWLKEQNDVVAIIEKLDVSIHSFLIIMLAPHLGDQEDFVLNYISNKQQHTSHAVHENFHFHLYLLTSERLKTNLEWLTRNQTRIEAALTLLKFALLTDKVPLSVLSCLNNRCSSNTVIVSYGKHFEKIKNLSNGLTFKKIKNLAAEFLTSQLFFQNKQEIKSNEIEIIDHDTSYTQIIIKNRIKPDTYTQHELQKKFATFTINQGETPFPLIIPDDVISSLSNTKLDQIKSVVKNNPWTLAYSYIYKKFGNDKIIIYNALEKEPLLLCIPLLFEAILTTDEEENRKLEDIFKFHGSKLYNLFKNDVMPYLLSQQSFFTYLNDVCEKYENFAVKNNIPQFIKNITDAHHSAVRSRTNKMYSCYQDTFFHFGEIKRKADQITLDSPKFKK